MYPSLVFIKCCMRLPLVKKRYFLIIFLALLVTGKYLVFPPGEYYPAEGERQRALFSLSQVVSFLSKESPRGAALAGGAVIFGFKEVASDFLFLQSIQIFGDWELGRKEKFKRVYPVLQTITLISPHFVPAYSFGALVLEELGYVDEAVDLLNKGIAFNPRAFELWLYRDFSIRLFRTREYKKAIEGIKTALRIEGHPPVLERILAYAYEKDGQIEEAIRQWERIYTSTKDPAIKKICERHLKKLKDKR